MGLLGRAAEDIPEAVEQGLPEVPGDLTGQEQTKNPSVPRIYALRARQGAMRPTTARPATVAPTAKRTAIEAVSRARVEREGGCDVCEGAGCQSRVSRQVCLNRSRRVDGCCVWAP